MRLASEQLGGMKGTRKKVRCQGLGQGRNACPYQPLTTETHGTELLISWQRLVRPVMGWRAPVVAIVSHAKM